MRATAAAAVTLLLMLLSPVLTACVNDDTVDGPVEVSMTDIVTFEGNDAANGGARLTLRQSDDSELITLLADRPLNNDRLPAGNRVMVTYVPASGRPYTSGNVSLRGYSLINNGTVGVGELDDYPDWNVDKVYLYSMWRDGTFINFHCRMVYTDKPRTFRFIVTPSSLDSDYPEIYLVHRLHEETDSHDRHYYASFDIGPVWNRPGCRGVRVIVANSNLKQDTFVFEKKQ